MHLNSASGRHDDDIILPLARPMRYSGAPAPARVLARDLLRGKAGAAAENLRAKKIPAGSSPRGSLYCQAGATVARKRRSRTLRS